MTQLVTQFATCAGYGPVECDPGALGYAAAEPGRRRMVTPTTKSEDQILDIAKRRIVIEDARDLRRNYALAAWAIRRHLDYVSTFAFQCKTKDKGLNKEIEQFIESVGTARRWDVTRRHSLRRMTRLAESHAVVDGDVGWHLLREGRVQGIEGERIRTPVSIPDGMNVRAGDLVHGVKLNKAGAAAAYVVNRRSKHGGWEFERMVPEQHLLLHGYFERYDKVRGISPLTSALNSFRDTYEAFDYALAKAKVDGHPGLRDFVDSAMIMDAEGTDEGKCSTVWAVRFGRKDVRWVLGQNGQVKMDDPWTESLVDDVGNKYTGYVQELLARVGLQCGSRFSIACIKTLSLTKTLDDDMMFDLIEAFKQPPDVFFMTKRSRKQLRSSRTATNATGTPAPLPTEVEGIPIVRTDSLLDTEDPW